MPRAPLTEASFLLRLPAGLMRSVQEAAHKLGTTYTEFIRGAIRQRVGTEPGGKDGRK